MCVDTANCSGTCGECMSDTIRRLTMANKQLTKMCDQYLAELAAERQRAKVLKDGIDEVEYRRADIPWLPPELMERLRSAIRKDDDGLVLVLHPSACGNLFRDILAACENTKPKE